MQQVSAKKKEKKLRRSKALWTISLSPRKLHRFKVLSLVHQTQEGSVSAQNHKVLPNLGDNMVLQSFELSASCCGDYLPPHMGDYAPSTAALYTDLDSSVYSQGK